MITELSSWLHGHRHAMIQTQAAAAGELNVSLHTYRSWENRAVRVDIHSHQGDGHQLVAKLALWAGKSVGIVEAELGLIPTQHHPVSQELAAWTVDLLHLYDGVIILGVFRDGEHNYSISRTAGSTGLQLRDIHYGQQRVVSDALERPSHHWELRLGHLTIFEIPKEDPEGDQ